MLPNNHWSQTDRRIATRAMQAGRQAESEQIVADFRRRAAAVADEGDVWDIADWLRSVRRDLDEKYADSYEVRIFVLARLRREGFLRAEDLDGLSPDKLAMIEKLASGRLF